MSHRRTFIRQIGLGTLGFGLWPGVPGLSRAETFARPMALPRSTPEKQGVSSVAIRSFLEAVQGSGQEFHSLMIIRHGHVIAEGWWYPYSSKLKQQLYSLSKSFTGTAIGFAVAEGGLTVEDKVISFFPDALPDQVSDNLAALQVKHLLSMGVGQAADAMPFLERSPVGTTWEKTFLSLPVVNKPGTQFLYNSGSSYMLSSIIKKVTGVSAHEYLGPRLYKPLDIIGATWTENAEGVNMGASHLRIKTEDIAKFGYLYLQKGIWNGKQVVSKDWVREASNKQIESGHYDSSWGYGYGYQFWLNPPGGFRADGAYGQYSMVLPDEDAVVAITSESISTATTMQLVWDKLVPEMKNAAALPENAAEYIQLQQDLKALAYEPPILNTHSPEAAVISGKEYALDSNPFQAKAVSFRFMEDKCLFTLKQEGIPDILINCGMNQWIIEGNEKTKAHSLFSLRRIDFDSKVAASAGWSDNHTLVLTFRFIETTHGDSLTYLFDEDKLTIKFLFSLARLQKKPDDRADIMGRFIA